jgi:hypothetical protein
MTESVGVDISAISGRFVDLEGGFIAHGSSFFDNSDVGTIGQVETFHGESHTLETILATDVRLRRFTFPLLGGATEEIFSIKVLPFLESSDLCSLAATCSFFNHISRGVHLWTALCLKDFIIDDETISSDHVMVSSQPFASHHVVPITKDAYVQRYKERHSRIEQAKQDDIAAQVEASKEVIVMRVQNFIDTTQLRLLIPLPITALFLSLLLFALHVDGYDISIWGCAAPLLFFVAYVLLSILFVFIIYKKQHNTNSIFHGLWTSMRGPIKSVFIELLGESSRLSYIAVLVILVSISQIILVAVKLSPPSIIPHDVVRHFNWGEVFAPMWMLFIIYCLSPVVSCITEPGIFIFGAIIFWVPFFILFVCLTLKLNAQDHHSNLAHMRMALIFVPFWILEGAVMLASLAFLVVGIYR